MKYPCARRYDQARLAAPKPEAFDAVKRGRGTHDRVSYAGPACAFVGPPAAPEQALTLIAGNDGSRGRDGAHARTGEPAGAFPMVEAGNLGDAIASVSLHPGARIGWYFGGGIEMRACDPCLPGPGLAAFGATA